MLVALAGVLYLILPALPGGHLPNDSKGGNNVAEPTGDTAAEQEAAAKLSELQRHGKSIYLVISEPPDKRVTSINFCGKPVGEDALALVPKLYRVITVNAGDCKITNDQLKYFSGLSILNNLILNDTPVTDAGLVHLRPLSNLGTLYLSGTQISDRGLDDVAALNQTEDIGPLEDQSDRRGTQEAAAAGRSELAPAVGNRDHRRRPGSIWRA